MGKEEAEGRARRSHSTKAGAWPPCCSLSLAAASLTVPPPLPPPPPRLPASPACPPSQILEWGKRLDPAFPLKGFDFHIHVQPVRLFQVSLSLRCAFLSPSMHGQRVQ